MKKLTSAPHQSPGRELTLIERIEAAGQKEADEKAAAGDAKRSAFMEADVSTLLSFFAGEIVLIPMQSTGWAGGGQSINFTAPSWRCNIRGKHDSIN
jgi:hypothetical protein